MLIDVALYSEPLRVITHLMFWSLWDVALMWGTSVEVAAIGRGEYKEETYLHALYWPILSNSS